MKVLLTLPPLLSTLFLMSCSLFGKKEEETTSTGSIPPPSQATPSDPSAPAETSDEVLPELPAPSAKTLKKSSPASALTHSGDFVFRDPTKDLPKSNELSSPASPILAPAPQTAETNGR